MDQLIKKDHSQQAISDQALSENVKVCYDRFRKKCGLIRKGITTENNVKPYFLEIIHEGFHKFIRERRLLNRLSLTDQESWDRFLEDYHLWKSGEKPCSDKGNSWLTYMVEDSLEGPGYGEEASYLDKIQFFKLMEVFHLPVEYFQPVAKGTICPDDHPGHFPNEIIVGWDIWGECNELSSGGFVLGNTITLTDHFGLESKIMITEHLASAEEKRKRQVYTDYIGIGCIEGYTTSRKREIHIDIKDGRVFSLSTFIDSDDLDAFNNYPLWKDAREQIREFNELQDEVVRDLIQFFLQSLY